MSPDTGRLEDMLRHAQLALAFTAGMSAAEFARDEKTQFAVIRCLEVIGEAANNVSAETQDALEAVPWRDIIRQRHVAVHHYQKLEMSRIWKTVTEDLPLLMRAIEAYLK